MNSQPQVNYLPKNYMYCWGTCKQSCMRQKLGPFSKKWLVYVFRFKCLSILGIEVFFVSDLKSDSNLWCVWTNRSTRRDAITGRTLCKSRHKIHTHRRERTRCFISKEWLWAQRLSFALWRELTGDKKDIWYVLQYSGEILFEPLILRSSFSTTQYCSVHLLLIKFIQRICLWISLTGSCVTQMCLTPDVITVDYRSRFFEVRASSQRVGVAWRCENLRKRCVHFSV